MSNDKSDPTFERASPRAVTERPDPAHPTEATPPLLVLAGADDLVCVDDTCLPPEAAR